nr:MAG TPA: hypothetical protein [Caudoviricetes sp.]
MALMMVRRLASSTATRFVSVQPLRVEPLISLFWMVEPVMVTSMRVPPCINSIGPQLGAMLASYKNFRCVHLSNVIQVSIDISSADHSGIVEFKLIGTGNPNSHDTVAKRQAPQAVHRADGNVRHEFTRYVVDINNPTATILRCILHRRQARAGKIMDEPMQTGLHGRGHFILDTEFVLVETNRPQDDDFSRVYGENRRQHSRIFRCPKRYDSHQKLPSR